MPYCPNCKTELQSGVTSCSVCGSDLVGAPSEVDQSAPVVVLRAHTFAEARVAKATLEAEGIPAFVASDDGILEVLEPGVVSDETVDLDVMVAADKAEAAREVLNAPSLTDEELDQAAGFEAETD